MSWLRIFCPMNQVRRAFAAHIVPPAEVNRYMKKWEFDMDGNPYYVSDIRIGVRM